MINLSDNQQKLNDIIFEGRNKNYGAYAIRSSYNATLLKSLLIMAGIVSALFLTVYLLIDTDDEGVEQIIIPDSTMIIPVTLFPEKPLPAVEEPVKNNPNREETNSVLTSTLISDTTDISAGTTTTLVSDNSDTDNPAEIAGMASSGNGNGDDSGSGPASGLSLPDTEIRSDIQVDRLPEFEGGLSALYKFISSNLKIPEEAIEANKGGRLFVRFVVDEEGKVSMISLRNRLGYGLDEEALRVVGMLPKFKSPAMVNGRAVKVYYQLPIHFRIQ